ncbi:hypothetical protein IQ247_01250 [Plectonema cf. radiosum LEGE 06105]|uniref:Uncharacterized protein n=1 Tax=Plectonema cf. radiosum LEGE 06105 TaxID=945769 RepID=A0A8J7F1U0_9CYAN|nr:hypothetical protein [Plectonema radiosum]MBE9211355.1 hypothetical protein [Plectonema cf. radiosum LEGE 06105]
MSTLQEAFATMVNPRLLGAVRSRVFISIFNVTDIYRKNPTSVIVVELSR